MLIPALPHLLGTINEFRDMVKALHRAGIEAIPTSFSITAAKETEHYRPCLFGV